MQQRSWPPGIKAWMLHYIMEGATSYSLSFLRFTSMLLLLHTDTL